ncbi:putative cytochrome P450 CYP44 [Babylonia areolata]|uniref:putative cytochrome P450 CYP44 n=1 Tax=Babylonia areolata TaxID=304850 RepID=UPI003FD05E7E
MHCMRHGAGLAHKSHLKGCRQALLTNFGRPYSTVVSSVTGFKSSGHIKPFGDLPGPGGLPYFGTYFRYKLGEVNVHKLFDTLKDWHRQYGCIFKEVCLGRTVVHVADPEAIHLLYATEGRRPHIEPLTEPVLHYRQSRGIALGLGNTNGQEWYQLRRAAQQMMMRPKEVLPYLPAADQVASDFVSLLKDMRCARKEVPNFATQLGRWSLESFGRHCFNTRLGYLTEEGRQEAEEVLAANQRVFDMVTQLFASLPVYQYTHIATPQWRKLFAGEDFLYDTFLKHFNRALNQLKEKTDSGALEEGELRFLGYLMSRKELSLKDVAILTHSLLYDPLSTVNPQLQFLLYLLATTPQAQDRLYEEIRSVAPPSPAPLTPQHVQCMQYFKACFKESVRMMPVINENTRYTNKDLVLGGYHIPAGTIVKMNNFVLYREPHIFTDHDVFMPERWLQEKWEHKVDPIIVQPFSFGPRMCIGRRFAEQDMAVLTTRLLQSFRLEWHHPPMGVKYMTLNLPDCPAQFTFHDR